MTSASTVLAALLGQQQTITVPRALLKAFDGDYATAVLCAQMVYWQQRTEGRHWFYKSYADWYDELMLSEYQVRKAVDKLKRLGFLATKLAKANGAPTLHYALDIARFSEWILEFFQDPFPTNSRIESEETQASNPEFLEEPVTESTTESTTGNGVADADTVTAPAPQTEHHERKPRAADPLWDSLVTLMGYAPGPKSPERGLWNRAVAHFRSLGLSPGDINSAATTYRRRYPDAELTVGALAKHAQRLLVAPPTAATLSPPSRRERELNALLTKGYYIRGED